MDAEGNGAADDHGVWSARLRPGCGCRPTGTRPAATPWPRPTRARARAPLVPPPSRESDPTPTPPDRDPCDPSPTCGVREQALNSRARAIPVTIVRGVHSVGVAAGGSWWQREGERGKRLLIQSSSRSHKPVVSTCRWAALKSLAWSAHMKAPPYPKYYCSTDTKCRFTQAVCRCSGCRRFWSRSKAPGSQATERAYCADAVLLAYPDVRRRSPPLPVVLLIKLAPHS